MTQITLSPSQMAALTDSAQPVPVCSPDGSVVGFVARDVRVSTPTECPFSPEEVAAAEEEALGPGPFHTTREVLDNLPSRRTA